MSGTAHGRRPEPRGMSAGDGRMRVARSAPAQVPGCRRYGAGGVAPRRSAWERPALVLWLALGLTTAVDAATAPAAGDAPPAAPLLEAVAQRFEQAAGLRAEFQQINRWYAFDEADTARGQLAVAPPDRFRLAYDLPAGHLVGADGRHVWTFVPEERQVVRAPLDATTGWGEFFSGALAHAADSLGRWSTAPETGPPSVRIALVPRPGWALRELFVEIDPARQVPVGYGYTDEEGNVTHFRLETPRFVSSLPESLFRFSVPDGYELFEAD